MKTQETEQKDLGYDTNKVDELVLALLALTTFQDTPKFPIYRAWKGQNWDTMNRLHEKGFISDPVTQAKSVVLTEEGYKKSQELFEKYFVKNEA